MRAPKRGANEAALEDAAVVWLEELDYDALWGPDIVPGEPFAERERDDEAFLPDRLRDALAVLNPDIPAEALNDAYDDEPDSDEQALRDRMRQRHRQLVERHSSNPGWHSITH